MTTLVCLSVCSLLGCIVWTIYTSDINHHPFSALPSRHDIYSKLSNFYRDPRIQQVRGLRDPVSLALQTLDKNSLERYHSNIFTGAVDLEHENFTIVMLTYRRVSVLPKLLLHYCPTPRLAKIVVIWNDVEREIPEGVLNLTSSCRVPLLFLRETENKITNRFKPRPEIQTDCKSHTHTPTSSPCTLRAGTCAHTYTLTHTHTHRCVYPGR